MEERQKIDSVVEDACQKIQKEIEGLIGIPFSLSQPTNNIIDRDTYVNEYSGPCVLTRLAISGNIEGTGWIVIAVEGAIRLGGTLIMLPESELDERVVKASLDEETEDSYGEIGNIIAGIYSTLFDQSPEFQCHVGRKEQHVVHILSDETGDENRFEDSQYYQVSSQISLDGKVLGSLEFLLPAAPFGLVKESQDANDDTASEKGGSIKDSEDDSKSLPDDGNIADHHEHLTGTVSGEERSNDLQNSNEQDDSIELEPERIRNDIDAILEMCRVRIQEEVGEVVGSGVSCSEMKNIISSKEQFYLDETKGKQVAVEFDVSGDVESSCYLYIGLKDAIRMGGALMMLPPDELEDVVSESTFSPDIQDAYEEVARVISGVYNEVFGEHYSRSVRFEPGGVEIIVPMKVDVESAEPIENQTYYLNRLKICLEEKHDGWIQTLFPTALFGLEDLEPELSDTFSQEDDEQPQQMTKSDIGAEQDDYSQSTPDVGNILIIGDEDQEARRLNEMLHTFGVTVSQINFRDKINDYLPGTFQAVILLMGDVDEQSLGMAIKINTSCSLPLIAIGSKWTRSKVLKALKYGVNDIVLIPVTEEDIRQKITSHLTSLAA